MLDGSGRIYARFPKKIPKTLSVLCRTANWLFFKTELLSGTARFRRCRASKYPFHMSSINRTCAAHLASWGCITNYVPPMSLQSGAELLLSCCTITLGHTWLGKFHYQIKAEGLENEAEPRSPTLTSLHLRHSSFSNPSAASPTSQLVLQPFRCFTYVIDTSLTSPGEPLMHL